MKSSNGNLGKGLLAGLVGGLIGTIVMSQAQSAMSKASKALQDGDERQGRPDKHQDQQESQVEQQAETATMKAAAKIAQLGHRQLSREERKKFGPVVHYSFGMLQGALYGGISELAGTRGGFLPALTFGTALFVAADEIAAPALGFSAKPTESPLSSHLYGLAAHLVYGLSTEMARRGLRAAL